MIIICIFFAVLECDRLPLLDWHGGISKQMMPQGTCAAGKGNLVFVTAEIAQGITLDLYISGEQSFLCSVLDS